MSEAQVLEQPSTGSKRRRRKAYTPQVECPYCEKPAVLLTDSSRLYAGRNFGPVWICDPCGAWVGTHKNSDKHAPLGRLANVELRKAKTMAHSAFDPFWDADMKAGKTKHEARAAAYDWLAIEMGIKRSACHIGYFNVEQCRQVVAICLKRKLETHGGN